MALMEGSGAKRTAVYLERRALATQWLILAVLGFFLFQYGLQTYRVSQAVKIESIDVSNVHLITPQDVCPGDKVAVAFDVDVQGFGILVWDSSTQHKGQPATFSEAKRVPIDGPVTLNLVDEWYIPVVPEIMLEGRRQWVPGDYGRLVTVSASSSYISRFVEPRKFVVPFRLKPSCWGMGG
jgi:hypothetical protein